MPVGKTQFTASGHGFSIRPARPDDLPAARALIMQVIQEDMGYAYNPEWHWDVDDLQGVYLDDPRHVLWVTVDDASGEIVATGGVRRGGPKLPPELSARYDRDATAQIVRVYVARAHRRRGIGRALVDLARQFAAADGDYRVICLHTDVRSPGAEPFWRSMPTTVVHDPQGQGDPMTAATLHFEMPFPDGPGGPDGEEAAGAHAAPEARAN